MHSPQVTPDAAAQQLSGAAEEASRSFGVGKSFGGSSSGLEQGAAGTTLEPPAPGRERGWGLRARSTVMEEQKPTRDQREIVECHRKTWCRGASSRRRLGLPHPFLPLLQHLPLCSDRLLSCLSRRRAVACPNSPCTAALQSRTPEALVSFLVLKPTELFLTPGPLPLLCSLLVPRWPLAPGSFSLAFRSWRPLCTCPKRAI